MKKRTTHILKNNSKLLLLLLLLFGCNTEPVYWQPKSIDLVISQYVESDENYSEFNSLMQKTGVSSLLAVRGPFTLFLPPNAAMQAYYAEKSIGSYLDLSDEAQTALVMNHVINAQIETGDIGLGALREVNGIGDYLVSEFSGSEIIINKNSKITKRDIAAANGVVHLVDRVLDPVVKSVFDVLKDDSAYSIFAQGLERTNLKDTLNIISFPYGTKTARTRYTILAVSDATFNSFGINSIDDLIAKYTDDPGGITSKNNGFYRYMEYHCLSETYYLSDLALGDKIYPILSYDNNIKIRVDDDYKINPDDDGNYTAFLIEQSNQPGKNGTVHSINGLLPIVIPKATTLTLETTDYFDLKQNDSYGKTYARFFDGQNTFQYIKWEGDYLLYYFKDHDTGKLLNDDCLSMSGWWWCQVTTQKIMKGKYKLTSNLWSGNINYSVYVDGVNTALVKSSDPAESTSWGEFEWTETERHTIKVVATSPGLLFWDTLIFTPID